MKRREVTILNNITNETRKGDRIDTKEIFDEISTLGKHEDDYHCSHTDKQRLSKTLEVTLNRSNSEVTTYHYDKDGDRILYVVKSCGEIIEYMYDPTYPDRLMYTKRGAIGIDTNNTYSIIKERWFEYNEKGDLIYTTIIESGWEYPTRWSSMWFEDNEVIRHTTNKIDESYDSSIIW